MPTGSNRITPMDEAKLLDKLRLIEALFAGATTAGERVAAAEARRRIQARLGAAQKLNPPVEYRFTMADAWSRRVFLALLRRYELKPYRYPGQRRTTVMVRAPKRNRVPEDCGGSSGYQNLLRALKNLKHPDHDELRTWVGASYDADQFDIGGINRQLAKVRV